MRPQQKRLKYQVLYNMKSVLALIASLFFIQLSVSQIDSYQKVLTENVTDDGYVNYKNLKKNPEELADFLTYLKNTKPDISWSINQQKAFWINAYNAYTLQLIIDYYPIKSIMDIQKEGKNAWKIPFAKVGGETYTLDFIEHEILRKKLFDPRIHVGVNCASISCPKLSNIAFTEENINAELDKLMHIFINDKSRNEISEKKVKLSELFNWFSSDFTKNSSIIDYLNIYSEIKIKTNAKISFLPYNWSLNELKTK